MRIISLILLATTSLPLRVAAAEGVALPELKGTTRIIVRTNDTKEDDLVSDIYTRGGYNHLRPLADLCRREGWRLGDAQEGEDVDLDDPYRSYEQRGA